MSTTHADSPPRIGVCFFRYGPLSVIAPCWTASCQLQAASCFLAVGFRCRKSRPVAGRESAFAFSGMGRYRISPHLECQSLDTAMHQHCAGSQMRAGVLCLPGECSRIVRRAVGVAAECDTRTS